MSETLSRWHAEHANFAKLLDLLERQLIAFHCGGSPDYELMLEIMYYMTHYPDVLHHPKEDLVFALIKERDERAAGTVARLLEQHVLLKASGAELVRELDGVVAGAIMSRERIETTARSYLDEFRSHMRIEEGEILPLASRLLEPGDWQKIDAAIRQFEDPLFGARTEQRYAALASQIVRQESGAGAPAR
ncbi:MAG TPA: hemerythrin domain-containing protein [Casimicrobiaceae bacterium]|nr:hemerythrin domain-containing protein [Casimicrobiaceae bacterium]